MRTLLLCLVCLAGAGTAQASPCRDDGWQPTYVHDLVNADGRPYYVMPDGSFVEVTLPYQVSGPRWCEQYGVRDRRGFTDCRTYTRVQCGCDGGSWANRTCAAFLASRGHARGGARPTGAALEVERIAQQETRDASGRITVEGALIHVIACNPADPARRHYIYQYNLRRAFRAILPPD